MLIQDVNNSDLSKLDDKPFVLMFCEYDLKFS